MNTIPTPRTDAQAGWAIANQYGQSTGSELLGAPDGVFVHAVFARTLERELAHERERSRLLLVAMNERDDGYTESRKRMSALESALNSEREKVRALKDALTRLRDCDWVIPLHEVQDIARDALAKAEESK